MNRDEPFKIYNKETHRENCLKLLPKLKTISLNIGPINQEKEAVFIEFRCFPHVEFLIRNVIYKLPTTWSHTVICGLNNYDFMKTMCKEISENIKIICLDINNLNQETYSKLLCSIEFWNRFIGEKIFIYQEDSNIFKSNIDEFLEYDYIGAAWPQREYVGNGGTSLRSKSVMIKCLQKRRHKRGPEDVFFTDTMYNHKIGNLAKFKAGVQFGMEGEPSIDPFCGHQFWGGHVPKFYTLEKSGYFDYLLTDTIKNV